MKKTFSLRTITLAASNALLLASTAAAAFAQELVEPWEGAHSGEAFGNGEIQEVFCDLVGLLEGDLGALIFMAAGVAAVIGAALGNLRHSTSAIVVGVGLFTISAGVGVFFGDFGCGGQGADTGRVRLERSVNAPAPETAVSLPFGGGLQVPTTSESPPGAAETSESQPYDQTLADIADTF